MSVFNSPFIWENCRHFAAPSLVSPRNDFWRTTAKIPYWWRVTIQFWVVTRHQYGIYVLVRQTLFRGETRDGAAKCLLFSQPSSREFTQRRRRRRRERQKSNRFRQAKQQLCTCITRFCTFLCRRCKTTRWNCLISLFVEDGNKRQQLSFSFPDFWCSPLEFNYKKIANIWRNKRDGISAIKFAAGQIHFLSDVS